MKELLERYDGTDFYLYHLSNNDFDISVTDYGATLCTFKYKGQDIVQGFENVSGYVKEVKYMNATIGRVCNRIGKGCFKLNNKEYHLAINNGPNTLHGGKDGFDTKKWEGRLEKNAIVFEYLSKDGEEGFPGNLKMEVRYELNDEGLVYSYKAISDQDTLVNICNHAFFNLNGPSSDTVLNDYLQINSSKVAKVDQDGLTLDECMDVEGTPFDFRKRKQIGKDINNNHSQIKNGNGYDHHYLIDGEGLRHFVNYDNGKLMLKVYSDLPGMHLYSGNYLEGKAHGKQGGRYPARSAICFETQYYPNAINYNEAIKPILKANEVLEHKTIFKVEDIKDED